MDRRTFLTKTSSAGILPILPAASLFQEPDRPLLKPRALPKNGTVSLVSPASAVSRSAFEKALANMEVLGLKVKYSPNVRVRSGFTSGTEAQRIDDLHAAFADESTDAVVCLRGGYGSARLLSGLDYELIRKSGKPIIGFSDITALLVAIYQKAGLVCFHGPVASSDFTPFTTDSFQDAIQKGKKLKIKSEIAPLVPGKAAGPLVGGNLSILCSLIGTPHEPVFKDHLLFLEEVGESTYRVDRMLTQLINSGLLQGVRGIAIGHFTGCDTPPEDAGYEYSLSLDEVFQDRLGSLGVPVIRGFAFGHESENATLPIGILAELDADSGELSTLASSLQD